MGKPNLVHVPREGNGKGIIRAIAKLASLRLNADSTPTFAALTLNGLTASRLLSTDSAKLLVSADLYSWVAQTLNQVLIADDGDGTITLSLPQNIHTGATPTFADLTLSSPSNIYGLSHDSFADFVATEHLDHALNQDANLVSWVRGYLSGTDAVDEAGGTTWTKAGNATNIDAGVIGPALTFDGTGDWFTDATPDNLPTGTSARTIFMRVRKNTTGTLIPFSYGGAGNGESFTFQLRDTGELWVTVAGGNAKSTSSVFNDLQWHSVAVTLESNDIADAIIYVDGVFTATHDNVSFTINTTNEDAFIGVYRDGTVSPFNGEIDELRIYSRVLNADEILEVHQLGTLDAMTTFDAAYFKKYIASRSGYFNNLHVSGIMNDVTMTGLTVTDGRDIDINASDLIGTGNIIPKTDGGENLGSTAKTFNELYIANQIFLDDGAVVGVSGGTKITFNDTLKFFLFRNGKVGIETDTPVTALTVKGTITLKEQAIADGDTTGYGQLWIKNTTPCQLWFTDDVGNDTQIV